MITGPDVMPRLVALAAFAAAGLPAGLTAQTFQLTGEVGMESRAFFRSPLQDGQSRHDGSLLFQPELYWELGRDQSITLEPFLRLDSGDSERTHFDLRVARWERVWDAWELRVGLDKVFWGVTESQHLVDVINQTDLVENLDGEDKLGQPMVNVAWIRDWGTVDFFLLPGFRERTFPGTDGRLRFPLHVEVDSPVYESGAEDRRLDWAVRWEHTLGDWDVGVAHFQGTSRNPRLEVGLNDAGLTVLVPHYDVIGQTSVDVQWTTGGWLWKFEGITRSGGPDARHYAMTGGFEYTFPQVFGSSADLGVIAEVLLDDRGSDATTPFQDDVFMGARLALNDVQSTAVLAGTIVDRKSGATLLNVEVERRVGENWTLEVQARAFLGADQADPLYGFRRDSYLSVGLTRYF